jgi:uncharacterized protein YukE
MLSDLKGQVASMKAAAGGTGASVQQVRQLIEPAAASELTKILQENSDVSKSILTDMKAQITAMHAALTGAAAGTNGAAAATATSDLTKRYQENMDATKSMLTDMKAQITAMHAALTGAAAGTNGAAAATATSDLTKSFQENMDATKSVLVDMKAQIAAIHAALTGAAAGTNGAVAATALAPGQQAGGGQGLPDKEQASAAALTKQSQQDADVAQAAPAAGQPVCADTCFKVRGRVRFHALLVCTCCMSR